MRFNEFFGAYFAELLMSVGGVAIPMCHGGGIAHKTIADRILKIGPSLRDPNLSQLSRSLLSFIAEYVDSNGMVQFVDDPELLAAAAGSLGLLGIVTAITYKVK